MKLSGVLRQTATLIPVSGTCNATDQKIYIKPQQPSNKISFGLILFWVVKFNTKPNSGRFFPGCILSNFYIKPQPRPWNKYTGFCCILSNFYIQLLIAEFRLKKSSLSYRRSSLNVVFSNSDGQMYQKNSNCWGVSGLARSILPQKFKVSPYCLSVTLRILVYPEGDIDLRTRLMQRLPGRIMQRLASRKSPLFTGGANSGLMWSIRL